MRNTANAAMLINLCAVISAVMFGASAVQTDRTGYKGGDTVQIEATGFKPYESIKVRIQPSAKTDGLQATDTQTVVADADGNVTTSWQLDQMSRTGEKFEVMVEGQLSRTAAKSEFKRIAVVQTDKIDYDPRSDVLITGSGFYPNEEVTLRVTHLNGKNSGAGHEPFSVISDAAGRISATWYVSPDDSDKAIFKLTAVGKESGLEAVSTFTDPPLTFVDDGGANDEPGQKDLTKLTVDFGNVPTSLGVTWQWDDTAWSGMNTGDACSLIDTDNDGFANFSLCVTVSGNPAAYQSTRLYSCGDGRTDRCTTPTLQMTWVPPSPPNPQSPCAATVVAGSDPFNGGSDTQALCTIPLSLFGSANAFLLNVCTYPSQEPNSDPADCVIAPNSGFLTITKVANPSDSTIFTFTTSRASTSGTTSFPITGSGSISLTPFTAAPLNITETVPAGWQLDTASCAIVGGSSTGTKTGNTINNVSIEQGRETVCTFTDSRILPKLTVTKVVVNDNGGTKAVSDFVLRVDGSQVTSGVQSTFSAGAHTVSEDAAAGYTTVIGGDCASDGSITLNYGDVKSCTITNDDIPPILHVIKHVVNDNGGTALAAAFTMSVTGASPSPSSFLGAESPGTTVSLNAGAYSVSETGPSGYASSSSADCSGTIAVGETKTCTITNNDIAGTLVVVKHVVNDNGGTATAASFTMSVTGSDPSPSSFPGAESPGTTVSLNAGVYSVSETGPSGYAPSYSADCAGTIALGQTKTCTVTNDDVQPQLIVIKHVINDNGGSAAAANFTMSVTGNSPGPASFPGAESPGTTILLNAGPYSVSETGPSGYAESFSADCSGTIAVGQTKTCTVTNNDQGATITLVKTVVNNHGGTATAANFQARIDGGNVPWETPIAVSPGNHTASETGVAGYAASGWSGACTATGNFTIALGETKTCAITNDDIPAAIVVNKVLIPADDAGRFNLLVGSSTVATNVGNGGSGSFTGASVGVAYPVGEAAVTPAVLADYVITFSGACNSGGVVTPAVLGGTYTCTITNTRRGRVNITKYTNGVIGSINWNFILFNGTAASGTPAATGTTSSGLLQFNQLAPGTYTLCETDLPAAWSASWTLGGGAVTPFNPDSPENLGRLCHAFTISAGGTSTFSINNFTPQGSPRTIGYWRNWNRCTGGRQAITADRNGGPANGFYLLEDVLPQLIGDLNVTTCSAGVMILNKRDLNGNNRANDGAYGLAAQLLAARANIAAQAVQCAALVTAVNAAQALLDGINFTGTGSYLAPNSGNQNLRNQALQLANTLDLYNNGGLCPVIP